MKILTQDAEKQKYRAIEEILFDKEQEDPRKVIKMRFAYYEVDPRDWWSSLGFYLRLYLRFNEQCPEFCISTALNEEPVILFDLKNDPFETYEAIMFSPRDIDLTWPHPDGGLMIAKDRIFMYDPDMLWCVYTDRYNDVCILAYT